MGRELEFASELRPAAFSANHAGRVRQPPRGFRFYPQTCRKGRWARSGEARAPRARGCYGLWGRGNAGLAGGAAGGGEATGKSPSRRSRRTELVGRGGRAGLRPMNQSGREPARNSARRCGKAPGTRRLRPLLQLIPQTRSCFPPRPLQGGGGGGAGVRARPRGGGLKGAVKVGNWENSLHARTREKEMHQREGRGAPVSRDGGRGLGGGAPARTAASGRGVGARAPRAPGRSVIHCLAYPVYYVSTPTTASATGAENWGAELFLSSTHLGLF